MFKVFAFASFISCVFGAFSAHSLELSIDVDNKAVEAFIKDVESTLPQAVKTDISKKLKISFKEFFGETEIDPERVCSRTKARAQRYGAAYLNFDKIELHAGFLNAIRDKYNGDKVTGLECGHLDVYSLAKGALIHELAHFYDYATFERKYERDVWQTKRANPKKPYLTYNEIHKNNFSSIPTYGFINGWRFDGSRSRSLENKHSKVNHSPDIYEYQDIKENFAVNFQFFLLDPEYKCRRPVQYEFLSKELNHIPFAGVNCNDIVRVPILIDGKIKIQTINKAHIRDVYYLFAGEAESMMSRWGHSMFRFTVCPPDLSDMRCKIDKRYNYVLNFTGFIPGLDIDMVDGLIGNYDSVVSISKLEDTIPQYTINEERNLYSFPMDLNSKEKERFINLAIQRVWNYIGTYKFISNNCATESLDFLKGIVWDNDFQNLKVSTPLGLKEVMDEVGMIRDFKEDEFKAQKRQHHFFPSNAQMVNFATNKIEKYLNGKKLESVQIEELLSSISHDQRLAWNLTILEGQKAKTMNEALLKKKINYLKKKAESDPALAKKVKLLYADHVKTVVRNRTSYGIPLDTDATVAPYQDLDLSKVVSSLDDYLGDTFEVEEKAMELQVKRLEKIGNAINENSFLAK